MKKLFVLLAGMILALGLLAVPASAETCFPTTNACQGGRLVHNNDPGLAKSVLIFCNYADTWDERKFVQKGTTSNVDCGDDTDAIWMRDGEELWCIYATNPTRYEKIFDATGKHKIDDFWERSCVLRAD